MKTQIKTEKLNFDRIQYHFQDSSVPPKYHRSFTIIIEGLDCNVTMQSYSKILAETNFQITEDRPTLLKELAGKLESEGKYITKGMSGTKTRSIELYLEGNLAYQLVWDSKYDKIKEGTNEFVEAVKQTVPNLSELLNTPYPEEE